MMDVDNDIEGQLLQQFSCMGTQDKEVLISQFQSLLGNQISQENCIFYLDMNNWNLQAAIGSFYDYAQQPQGPQMKVPCMALVNDVTVGEGEAIPPNTPFVKTWRVKNNGTEPWPPGCALHYIAGVMFGSRDRVMVGALQPGEHADISIHMTSPHTLGMHEGQWRMQMPTGMYFGDIIWVIVQVEEHGLLGVTQQLSNIGSAEFSQSHASQHTNPFGSPVKTESIFPGQVSPVMSSNPSGLFSSPTPSMITHSGSVPTSPAVTPLPITPLPHPTPSPGICTALFQSSGSSIPPMEGNPPPSSSSSSHDMEMS